MPLHRLTTLTLGVPDVDPVAAFYREFGLQETGPGRFATVDGGEQLRIEAAPYRRVHSVGVGVDDPDDLDRIASNLSGLGIPATHDGSILRADDPGSGTGFVVSVADRIRHEPVPQIPLNGPGRTVRENVRSEALAKEGVPVAPRRWSHMVMTSPDAGGSIRFLTEGIGFKVSDKVGEAIAFLRCSTDHHNVAVQQGPCTFLHHSAWEVDNPDEILRGGAHMLERDPSCHMWGFGRHYIGSNYFWYLRDPAGNFAEYTSDLDAITQDDLWTPGEFDLGPKALSAWGPPPPMEFIAPADVPDLIQATAAAAV